MADAVFTNPVATYLDHEQWERERDVVFSRSPIVAGLSVEVREHGDFKVLDIAGRSVVITRGSDGNARAFLNVCRHRGAPVAEGTGCTQRFTCPYHAWTYDSEGTLVGIPGAEGFDDLDRTTRGLAELPCEERSGLIFVTTAPDGQLDLDARMGPLLKELALLRLDELHQVGTKELPAKANWKVAMDTHTESYHFPFLHGKSIGPFTMGNLNVVDLYGTSQRVGFAACTLPDLLERPEAEWVPEDHIQLVYLLFPNNSLLITGDHVELFQIFPGQSVSESITHQSYYWRRPVETPEDEMMAAAQFEMFHSVVRDEDYPISEKIQDGMSSGANDSLVFGRNEPALHHLHRSYAEVFGL